jgi:hypothetical protein
MATIGNDAVDRVKNTSPMPRPGCPLVGFVATSNTSELTKSKAKRPVESQARPRAVRSLIPFPVQLGFGSRSMGRFVERRLCQDSAALSGKALGVGPQPGGASLRLLCTRSFIGTL